MAQEPVPAPDPAPGSAAPDPAAPATGARPDPAPASGAATGASRRTTARPSPAPVAVRPAQPVVSRRVSSAPARVTRSAATAGNAQPTHRGTSHRGAHRAKAKATAAVRRAAAPDFPTVSAPLAIAGGHGPDRRLALAGGALLALAVASTGLLALTARDQRRRPRT
jgi:hypothetical protein